MPVRKRDLVEIPAISCDGSDSQGGGTRVIRSQSDALSEVGVGKRILKVLVTRDFEFCVWRDPERQTCEDPGGRGSCRATERCSARQGCISAVGRKPPAVVRTEGARAGEGVGGTFAAPFARRPPPKGVMT